MTTDPAGAHWTKKLEEAVARQELANLCYTYCRALDRVDEALLRTVFHADSIHRHGDYIGTSDEFCGYAIAAVSSLHHTHHQLGNTLFEVQGNIAYGESYFTAYHRVAKGHQGFGDLFGKHDTSLDEDVWIGGRYIDKYECRDGIWKISSRTGVHDWEKWATADERELPLLTPGGRGVRDRTDPSYFR